jgi:biotin-(acetyl-CoA carboxylase) ligase
VIPASDIDRTLLSFCDQHWRKVARIIGQTMQSFEARGIQVTGKMADEIDARMAVLVRTRQLEAQGNIRNWRHSEVRLPPAE